MQTIHKQKVQKVIPVRRVRHRKRYLMLAMVMMLPIMMYAQPGFGDDVEDVPIDGGLSLLVAAGVGYGAKKMREKKVNKN